MSLSHPSVIAFPYRLSVRDKLEQKTVSPNSFHAQRRSPNWPLGCHRDLLHKCIFFPANGSEAHIVHRIARILTVEDLHSHWPAKPYVLCSDMPSTSDSDCRKVQVMISHDAQHGTYLFFYDLRLDSPINLNVARAIGVTPSQLKLKKRLFWRGDVVAMKVRAVSGLLDRDTVVSLDADISDLRSLEGFLHNQYQEGALEHILHDDELQWHSYISRLWWPTSLLFGAPILYWGLNAAKKEENFLRDLNERRCAMGRVPLRPPFYMKSYIEIASTLYCTIKSAIGLRPKVIGPPKLPPELELLIFETCALESPEVCTVLVLVAKRVYAWIDPILIKTVIMDSGSLTSQRDKLRLGQFLVKLTNGKPVEYYAQHIKNLAIFGVFSQNEVINRILGICSASVENLVLLVSARGFDFFENPQAGRNLRRLTIHLGMFFQPGSTANFYHPCFANVTHLHLWDGADNWPTYAGWEALTSLTHLAFAFAVPEKMMEVMRILPAVRYVAIGRYNASTWYRYADAAIDNSPHGRERFGARTVLFFSIPQNDWERGARGEGDFWDIVEQEVERRRLKEGSGN